MSGSRKTFPLLLMSAVLLAAPVSSWAQDPPKETNEPKVKPLVGKEPPFCETCGIVVSIKRVPTDELATKPTGGSTKGPDKFEVVVRLDAGTQQVVKFDVAPQLKIGQKVRIVNGMVVPELA